MRDWVFGILKSSKGEFDYQADYTNTAGEVLEDILTHAVIRMPLEDIEDETLEIDLSSPASNLTESAGVRVSRFWEETSFFTKLSQRRNYENLAGDDINKI